MSARVLNEGIDVPDADVAIVVGGTHGEREHVQLRLTPSSIVVGGLGGCYAPSDYGRPSKRLQGYAKRHYTREEIEALAARGHVDVLLLHDAPLGVRFPNHDSVAVGLDELLAAVSPRICLFGHHHTRIDAEVAGIRCIGLNIVGRPGNLVALELEEGGSGWSVLGEWPKSSSP